MTCCKRPEKEFTGLPGAVVVFWQRTCFNIKKFAGCLFFGLQWIPVLQSGGIFNFQNNDKQYKT